MKKKILYLIFSDAPSSIVRAKVFKNKFTEKSFEVDYFNIHYPFIENWLNSFSRKNYLTPLVLLLKTARKFSSYFKRLKLYSSLNNYDCIVLIKYTDINFVLSLKKKFNGKILYDFDDAIWLPEFIGATEFEQIIANCDFISCDNSYLMEKAIRFNPNTFVLNGPSQIELFDKTTNIKKTPEKIFIGWVGSPYTLFYLYAIYDALEAIGRKFKNVELVLLGTGFDNSKIPPFENIKVSSIQTYNQTEMIGIVKSWDIGIYPLFKNQLSLGRGSLKATIYMSAKLPVVCSAIGGENERIILDGDNGFLAKNTDDWILKLSLLIEDKKLRESIGLSGYHFVSEEYSIDYCFNQLNSNVLVKL